MEKFIVSTGKTIELAIEAALQKLKLDRDSVSVEVLKNARSGFLGIGASPAEVKVTYQVPDEPTAPKAALSSASRSKPKERPELTQEAAQEKARVLVEAGTEIDVLVAEAVDKLLPPSGKAPLDDFLDKVEKED